MNNIKYFFQFLIIIFFFTIFKIIGLRFSTLLSGKIFTFIGSFFRSKTLCQENLGIAFLDYNTEQKNEIIKKMWFNYGCIFAEYVFINNIKKSQNIIVENQHILDDLKRNSNPVIFVSGHFNNFELMAMHINNSGINLSAIYRPLNNIFLNPLMEKIRKKYICEKQIKKGISGTKEILKNFKNGSSIALMIDQRVSEGIKVKFFNKEASTTTIPAQFVKKFNAKIVPIYIERIQLNKFKIKIYDPIGFKDKDTLSSITIRLNEILEKMIMKNPEQWIWTHNRWK